VINSDTYFQLFIIAMACLLPPLIKKIFIKEEAKHLVTEAKET